MQLYAEGDICEHWNLDNVADNLIGRLIYKDECCKCFASTRDPEGLAVCLRTLAGYCVAKHAKQHYEKSGAPIQMIIKQVPKPKDPEAAKITKLAIGKEGGAGQQEEFDTDVQFYCHCCAKYLDPKVPKIKAMADSILLAQSAYDAQAVGEWELKLEACEHTLIMDQKDTPRVCEMMEASTLKCAECDLKTGLWLCMTSGHIGCGRKNYDGSGGNNHALDWYKKTGHAVCVKLGTITPEGSASVHCYACDDEVLDPELPKHLNALGLDVAQQVKTEKTIAEQELEANLSLTLSKVLEEGKTLKPVFGPLNTGLQNLGNTCYMNSVLQVLFSQAEFRDKYAASAAEFINTSTKFPPEDFGQQVRKLALAMSSGEYSTSKVAEKTEEEVKEGADDQLYQDGVRPQMFKTLVGKGHPEFQTGKQQDAAEYMHYLLDKVMKEEKKANAPNPGKMFEYELEKRLQCSVCKKVRYKKTTENMLLLTAPVSSKVEKGTPVDIDACFEKFFADGEIEDVQCSGCGAKTTYIQRSRFLTFPKILWVTLQRFVYDDYVPRKLEIELQLPHAADSQLDIQSKYMSTTNCQVQPGEEGLPDAAAADVEPELDQGLLNQVLQMGIPENPAKHALYKTGNNNADLAVSWYFENMADPSINEPLRVKAEGGAAQADAGGPDPEHIAMLAGMGFPEKKCKKALRECDNNMERAMEWIFSHPDDDGEDDAQPAAAGGAGVEELEEKLYKCPKPGVYQLQSFVTHLGASVHAGHYVCHVNKPESVENPAMQWIYFNDGKVAQTNDAPFGKGYMYFFVKK